MTELQRLLGEIADDARPYDVTSRALLGGRRRQRRKRLAFGGLAALSVTSVVIGLSALPPPAVTADPLPTVSLPPTPASVSCTVRELPRPPGYQRQAFVTGGDPTGRYLLGRLYPNGNQDRLAIWDADQIQSVAMPGSDDTLEDITTTGVAVGTSYLGENLVSWIYRDGVMSRLGGDNAAVTGINENLMMSGTINGFPAVWRSPQSPPEELTRPPGEWGMGNTWGISDDGYIIGLLNEKDQPHRVVPLIWHPDGSVHRIPVPGGAGDPTASIWAQSIRGDYVVGQVVPAAGLAYAGEPNGQRWNFRTGEFHALPPGFLPGNVNAAGAVTGDLAFITTTGQMVPLPHDIEGYVGRVRENGEQIPEAVIKTISDDGHTLAGTLQGSQSPVGIAVRWTCG